MLAEHLGMKLEYSIQPEEETEMTYKKFLRIVHKQIASANAGFPNSKIIALVGAAWKDYKAEMVDKGKTILTCFVEFLRHSESHTIFVFLQQKKT